jgi:hypothetical protein
MGRSASPVNRIGRYLTDGTEALLENKFSQLPARPRTGEMASLYDANTDEFGAAVTAGGGTKHVMVRWNGVRWIVVNPPTTVNVRALGATGNGTTDDTTAVQAAITAVASTGGLVYFPPGTYKLTAALTISGTFVTLAGQGRSSILSIAHTGNAMNVSGQEFTLRDIGITVTTGSTRVGSVIINPTNILGHVENVVIQGGAANNGGFAGHVTASGSAWTYEHIRFIGGFTWEYLFKTKSPAGTMAGLLIDDLIVFSTTFSDAGLIFDTLTDTVKVSKSQIVSATSAPAIHVRNTGAAQAPRWIHFVDVSSETNSLGPCLKVDDGRAVRYTSGYFATAVNAVTIAAPSTEIEISHNEITNISQHGITVAASVTGIRIHGNYFDDGAGLTTTNTYDCINIANSVTNFNITDNYFRQPSANKPRYGINISGAGDGFFIVEGNDTTAVAWGTAAFNNASTSVVQRIWANPGIGDLNKDSAAASKVGAFAVTSATSSGVAGELYLGSTSGFGAGAAGTAVTTTTKGAGTGPTTPQTVVKYLKINLDGTDYWVPLTQ